MIKKNLFKSILVITSLLLQLNLLAQTSPVTIHVGTAGTLPTLIAENQKYETTDLTLTGSLNGTDIWYIREMAGCNFIGFYTDGKLANLDLSGANIVSGGNSYFKYFHSGGKEYYTANNQISDYMFIYCISLETVILPKSVTLIGNAAFQGCGGLTSITIPNNVTSIGEGAFGGCTGLKKFVVSEENPNYSALDGVLFNKDKTILLAYPNASSGVYSIPNGVTSIGNAAFQGCRGLTSVTIPNTVTSIGNSAFFDCSGLTNITIGSSVTSIGGSAFFRCYGLTSVTIPNSVTSIGERAFQECDGLTSVTIGSGVTQIQWHAFWNCTGLTEIYSKNLTPAPLLMGWGGIFYGVNKTACKLYVPKGPKLAYQSVPQWQDFENIIEIDMTSINSVEEEKITIQSISNAIVIETKEATPVSVYTLSGQQVYQSVIIGNAEINLNKGVYIVRINNESQKVVVK